MNQHQRNLFELQPEPWELDDQANRLVASVVFTEGAGGPFDYLIPDHLRDQLRVGQRLRVPFGRGNRPLTGYCVAVGQSPTSPRRLKEVAAIEDQVPLLAANVLKLSKWMSEYYLASWGRVLETIIPAGVRGNAGTRQQLQLTVPDNVINALDQLRLPPKQAQVLRLLASSPDPLSPAELARAAGCGSGPINQLRKKGLIHGVHCRVRSHQRPAAVVDPDTDHQLNSAQQRAVDATLQAMHASRHEVLLLHGVTGSGKTEVYMRAIHEVNRFGRQAIVLVPEISLTPQTQRRFQARFPQVAVLHSHLSDAERNWYWRQIAQGAVQVVVGARSAIFAPTPHLGLIVLDEEHDSSFKQDTVPRYHARDVAIFRAKLDAIPLILGSATPSLESWHHARQHRYRLLSMPRRILDLPLPEVTTVDLREESRDRFHRGAISRPLSLCMQRALQEGGQVILLLNRRGFSTHIQCPACGEAVKCPHCDIAMTHHREGEIAVCHYCDHQIPAPRACPTCGFEGIRYGGFGTQRLEAEVRSKFPDQPCLRMDSDTMRSPGSHERAFHQFRSGEIKILLGTQMIAKGLDFPNVTLVGVINADTALHLPDFRAAERTFQLVTQVAGRTGRGPRGGSVVVQTYNPEHAAIVAAQAHNYLQFADAELPTREAFAYPPFGSMIRVIVRGPRESATEQFAQAIAAEFRRRWESSDESSIRLLGPAAAPIAKLRGKFRYHLLIQCQQLDGSRSILSQLLQDLKSPEDVQWVVDVDPIDML